MAAEVAVNKMRGNKAQSALEFTLMFALMVALLGGLLTVWKKWCNQIMPRQELFKDTRVRAGN